jgi:UDP-N-acetylglucosamine acyltransferase
VHQFCRVGRHAMLGTYSVVLQDVPPYVTVLGYPAKPHGVNSEGLRRRDFPAEDILAVRRAYKTLYREGRTLDDARSVIGGAAKATPALVPLAEFLAEPGHGRGILR